MSQIKFLKNHKNRKIVTNDAKNKYFEYKKINEN